MKKWKCTVCGYVHTGEEPPDKCPVCGADKSKFVLLEEEEEKKIGSEPVDGADRKWKCTVCGYVHTGPEPPDKCPVCGADKSKFEEILEADEPKAVAEETVQEPSRKAALYKKVTDLMVQYHGHPISVHIPNGVAPVAVLFLILSRMFDAPTLETASYCNMIVVLLAMPMVIFAGYVDWQNRFGGNMTGVFKGKIFCAGALTLLAMIVVIWRTVNPEVGVGPNASNGYLAIHLGILGTGAVAGFLGGKLVFNQN